MGIYIVAKCNKTVEKISKIVYNIYRFALRKRMLVMCGLKEKNSKGLSVLTWMEQRENHV